MPKTKEIWKSMGRGWGDIESPGIVEGEREKEHIRKEKRMVIMWKAQRR